MAQFEVSETSEAVAEEAAVPSYKASPVTDSGVTEPGQDIAVADVGVLATDMVNDFAERALVRLDLPTTDENKEKAILKLTEKLDDWIKKGDIDLDIDVVLDTKEAVQKALMRKGLEDTAANIKKLIEGLV